MNGFRDRLKAQISASSYAGNYRKLSLDADLGERRISNLLNDEAMDTSTVGPGLFAMGRVADLLNVSLDYLAGRNTPKLTGGDADKADLTGTVVRRTRDAARGQIVHENEPPTPQSLLRLFARSGGRIEAFEACLPYCDLYNPIKPDADVVSVKAVGNKSLSAITMGDSQAATLQFALANSKDSSLRQQLVDDHLEVMRRGTLCTAEALNIQMPNKPVLVKMDYIRVLMCLSDASGTQTILAHASLIV